MKVKILSTKLFSKDEKKVEIKKTFMPIIVASLLTLFSFGLFGYWGFTTSPNWGFYNAYAIPILGVICSMWKNKDKMSMLWLDSGAMGVLLLSYYIFFVTELVVPVPIKIVMGGGAFTLLISYIPALYGFFSYWIGEKFVFSNKSKIEIREIGLIAFIAYMLIGWAYYVFNGILFYGLLVSLCYLVVAVLFMFRLSCCDCNHLTDMWSNFIFFCFIQIALILIMQILGFDNFCESFGLIATLIYCFAITFVVHLIFLWCMQHWIDEYSYDVRYYLVPTMFLGIILCSLQPLLM